MGSHQAVMKVPSQPLGIMAGPIRGLHSSVWVRDGHVTQISWELQLVCKVVLLFKRKKKFILSYRDIYLSF